MSRTSIALVVVALMAAACGGAESSDGVARLDESATTTSEASDDVFVDVEEAALAFAECLRGEGLDVEDPEFDGEGGFGFNFREVFGGGPGEGGPGQGPNEEFQAAFEVCGGLLEGIAQQFERPDQTEIQDDLLAFAECMRDNGVEMPDPDFSGFGDGPGGGGALFGQLDLDDPTVEAAFETCQSELAFGGPGGGPGRPGGGDS